MSDPAVAATQPPAPGRHRVLGNPVARTVLSVWAWIVLVTVIIVWTPMVFVVWECWLLPDAACCGC